MSGQTNVPAIRQRAEATFTLKDNIGPASKRQLGFLL